MCAHTCLTANLRAHTHTYTHTHINTEHWGLKRCQLCNGSHYQEPSVMCVSISVQSQSCHFVKCAPQEKCGDCSSCSHVMHPKFLFAYFSEALVPAESDWKAWQRFPSLSLRLICEAARWSCEAPRMFRGRRKLSIIMWTSRERLMLHLSSNPGMATFHVIDIIASRKLEYE